MVSRAPLTVVVLLASFVWALALMGNGWILPASFFLPVSGVVSALSIALTLWDTRLWRLRLLHPWPVSRPDLTGTWRGEITRVSGDPILIYLVVTQTWSQLAYRTFTAESRSASVAASVSEVDGQLAVAALYRNDPDLLIQDRSRTHRGALWLWVHGPPVGTLKGSYWTDRDTKGAIQFERVSMRVASDFESARALAEAAPRIQASPSSLRSLPREMPSRRAASD